MNNVCNTYTCQKTWVTDKCLAILKKWRVWRMHLSCSQEVVEPVQIHFIIIIFPSVPMKNYSYLEGYRTIHFQTQPGLIFIHFLKLFPMDIPWSTESTAATAAPWSLATSPSFSGLACDTCNEETTSWPGSKHVFFQVYYRNMTVDSPLYYPTCSSFGHSWVEKLEVRQS